MYPYSYGETLGIYLEKDANNNFSAVTGSGSEINLATTSTGILLGDGHTALDTINNNILDAAKKQESLSATLFALNITDPYNGQTPTPDGPTGTVQVNSAIFGSAFDSTVNGGKKYMG